MNGGGVGRPVFHRPRGTSTREGGHAIPKGVGLDTLHEILAGWAAVLDHADDRYRLPDEADEPDSGLDGALTTLLSTDAVDVDTTPGTRAGSDALALSLDLSLDAEPDDVEHLVRAIRRGLTEDPD